MSRKRLSRTVIEGGRVGRNKWERRHSHNEERTSERDYCQRVSKDPECYDEEQIVEKNYIYKEFRDKLGPMYRWLYAQVGRPWNDVYSEVKTKFDDRTTAGRHIVNDHLKRSVTLPNDPYQVAYPGGYSGYSDTGDTLTSYSQNDFYVDEEGTLKVKTYVSRKNHYPKFDTNRICNWLSGRSIGQIGNKMYWFVPADKSVKRGGTKKNWVCVWGGTRSYYRPYRYLNYKFLSQENVYKKDSNGVYLVDENNKYIVAHTTEVWREGTPNFRQDRKFTDKDLQFWNSLPDFYKEKVLELSPLAPPKKPDFNRY